MSLLDQITTQMTTAMKSGDQFTLDVLRMAKTALQNATIAKDDHILSETDEIQVMQKEVKKRHDAVEMYKQGGRPELAEKEEKEARALSVFLPKQASDDEIESIVIQAIESTGATSKQDMGRVMGVVMPQLRGKAEPGRISAIVQKHLS